MASYTALMNIKVDSKEASKGLNTLSKNLTNIEKTGRRSSTTLSRLEKSFFKIEKNINSAVGPIIKMQKSLDKLAGKQMSGYQRIVMRLIKDNAKLGKSFQQVDDKANKLALDVTNLNKKIDDLEKRLKKLGSGPASKAPGKLTDLFTKLGKAIRRNEFLFYSLTTAALGFIKINLIAGLIRITDQYTLMANRIRLVNDSQKTYNNNLKAVKQIAQQTRQSLYAIANLYSRVGRNSRELAKDTVGLSITVSTIAKSFQIAGATAEEARNAIVQLSQALASGRLQGDELRSILELAPTLAQSISKSLGITLGSLRSFASEGLITTNLITKAVRESAAEIDKEFKKIVPTIGQSITNVQNAIQIAVGETESIMKANKLAALSFLRLATSIEKLAGGPFLNKFGEILQKIARNIDKVVISGLAFISVISGFLIIGALVTVLGGLIPALAALTGGLIAAKFAFDAIDDATQPLAASIRTVDEVIKSSTASLKDNATESEIAAANLIALETESYNAALGVNSLQEEIIILNTQLAQGPSSFEKWIRAIDDFLDGPGKRESPILDSIFGNPEKIAAELDKKLRLFEESLKRSEALRKEIEERRKKDDDGTKVSDDFLEIFTKQTDRTNRRIAARFQSIRDLLQDKIFNNPFEIVLEPSRQGLVDLNDTLRRKIGEVAQKRAKGSVIDFLGITKSAEEMRRGALSGSQLTAENTGIEAQVRRLVYADKEIKKLIEGGGDNIPKILVQEIVAVANEELLKFQEKVLNAEVQLQRQLEERRKTEERQIHTLVDANSIRMQELKSLRRIAPLSKEGARYVKDGVNLNRLKIKQIQKEYNLKLAINTVDMKAEGHDTNAIVQANQRIRLLYEQKLIEESITQAIAEQEYLSRGAESLSAMSDKLTLAEKEYVILKSYNGELDRIKFNRMEERRILERNKDLDQIRNGIIGEAKKIDTERYKAQLDMEDSLREQNRLLKIAKDTDQERLNFNSLAIRVRTESRNQFAEKNRLDSFLMKDQIRNLNQYNIEVTKMVQKAGISLDVLRDNSEYLNEFGLTLLELPKKLDGVSDSVLQNLREREQILRRILGLENKINEEKSKQENPLFEGLREAFPEIDQEGSITNKAFKEIAESYKLFLAKQTAAATKTPEEFGGVPSMDVTGQSKGEGGILGTLMGFLKDLPGIGSLIGGMAGGPAGAAAGGIFDGLGQLLGDSFTFLADTIGAGFNAMLGGIDSVGGILGKILISTLKSEQFQEAMNAILEPFNEMFDMIGEGIGEVFRGLAALVEPLMGIFDLFGGFLKGFLRSFIRIIEPFGRLFERLQPLLISLGALLQGLLMVFNSIFEFIGNIFEQVFNFFDPTTDANYKSLVLLKSERDVIQDIESSLEGVADVLNDIDDALFDITNSSLNLAAPSLKLETAAEKYQELYAAATRFGADETAISDFTAFAKQFLQQSQDVLKSSSTYQDIYDNVIKDVMAISDNFVEELSTDVTETIQKGVFDLKVVGSDLGEAIENIVSKYESGAISFGTLADYMSLKLSQIEADIELRDMADFGAIDIGNELDRYAKMRGTPSSGKSLEDDLKELSGVNSSLTSAVLDLIDEIQDSNGGVGGRSTGRRGPNLSGLEEVDEGQIGRPDPKDNPFDLFSVDLGGIFENLAQFVIDALTHAFEQIIGTFEELLNIVLEPVRRLTDGSFAKMIEHLFESIFGLITDGKFVKFLEEFFGSLFGIFTNVNFGDFIETFFGGFFEAIGEITSAKFLQELLSFIPKIAVSVGDFLSNLFAPILDLVGKLNPLHYLFGNSPSGILAPIVALVVDVGDFLSGLFEPITNLVVDVGDWVSAAIIEPMSNMGNLDIADWVENILLKPVRDLSVGLIDYFTAILFPILSIGEVAFDTYMSLVFYPLRDLYMNIGDFILEIFKPITGMGDVSMSDFLKNLFKPLENLTVDITDWFSSLVSDPISTMGDLDPKAFLSALIDPLSNLGSIDGSQVISALLKPLEDIGNISLASWIDNVIIKPLSGITIGVLDFLNTVLKPITDLNIEYLKFLEKLLKPIIDLNIKYTEFLKEVLKPITNLIGSGNFNEFLSEIMKPISGISANIEQFLKFLFKPIEAITGISFDKFLDFLTKPISNLTGGSVQDVINKVLSFATAPVDLAKYVGDNLSKILNIDQYANLGSAVVSKLGQILNIDQYANLGSQVVTKVGQILNIDKIVNFGTQISTMLGQVLKIDKIVDLGDWLSGKLGSLAATVFDSLPLLPNPFHQFGLGPKHLIEFEKGGYLSGPSHRQGGIPAIVNGVPIEMEGGEYIINKKAVDALGLGYLDEINSFGSQIASPASPPSLSRGPDPVRKFSTGGSTNRDPNTMSSANPSQSSFNVVDFNVSTGGTIADIMGGTVGMNFNVNLPGALHNLRDVGSVYSNVPYFSFQTGGSTQAAANLGKKVPNIQDLMSPKISSGYTFLGRASLQAGVKDFLRKPVLDASYEAPNWLPENVKQFVEEVGGAVVGTVEDVVSNIGNIANQIGSVIQGIIDQISSVISGITSAIGSVLGQLGINFPGVSSGGSIRRIPLSTLYDIARKILNMVSGIEGQIQVSGILNEAITTKGTEEVISRVDSLYNLVRFAVLSGNSRYIYNNSYSGVTNPGRDFLSGPAVSHAYEATRYHDIGQHGEQNTFKSYFDELKKMLIGGIAVRRSFSGTDGYNQASEYALGSYGHPFGDQYAYYTRGMHGFAQPANPFTHNASSLPNIMQRGLSNTASAVGAPDTLGSSQGRGYTKYDFDSNSTALGYNSFSTYNDPRAEITGNLAVFGNRKGKISEIYGRRGVSGLFPSESGNVIYRGMKIHHNDQEKIQYLYNMLGLARTKLYNYAVGSNTGVTPFDLLSVNLNKIRLSDSTLPGSPFEKGGPVIGPSHSQGGVFAELEGGEFVVNKKAVNKIGLDQLNNINNMGLTSKFENGGPVIGRRDYDPLLAQAITEQYRNADLEGGTFDQISSIYNQISGTGLSADTAASLTEIFGVPRGFFDEINFEGLTDDGISNSIIDGISDVFESPGDPTGSYPVTVVSEEMYLKNMTKPLDAVIVNTDNYLSYMTEPLPSNIYKSNYLSSIFAPLGALDSEVDSNDYLRRLFLPVTYVELSNTAMTEAFADLVDSITINSQDFSDSVVSKIEELPFLEIDEANFLSNFLSPLENLVISQESFLALLKPVFDAILVDATEYTQLALSPIQGIIPTETEVLDNFFNAFSNVESDNLTKVFEDILYEIFDFSVITGAIDDLVEKYSTDGNSDSDLRLTFGSSDLIDKLDELWESGLVVDLRNIETKAYGQIEELLKQNTEILVDNLPENVPGGGGGGGGNQGGGRQGDTTAPSLYDIIVGGENSDLRKLGDLILTPEGRDQIFGELGNPTEVFKNLNDFLNINTKTLQEFDLNSFLDNQAYNLTSTDRLVDWLDQNTDTLNFDFENIELNPFTIYENFKEANLNDMQKQVADTLVTGFGTAGMDAALESVLGLPTFDGVGITAFLVAYEAANPGKLAEGFDNLTSLEPGDKDRNALAALLSGQTGGAFDLSDDFDGLIDIGNMYKVPRDQLLGFLGLDGIDVGDPLRGQDIRDIGAYDVQGTDIERAINSILPTGLGALNEFYNLRDSLAFDVDPVKGLQTSYDDFVEDFIDTNIPGPNFFDMTGIADDLGPRFFDMTGIADDLGPNFFDMTGIADEDFAPFLFGPRPEQFFNMSEGYDTNSIFEMHEDFKGALNYDHYTDLQDEIGKLGTSFSTGSYSFGDEGSILNQDLFSGMGSNYFDMTGGIGIDFDNNLFSAESGMQLSNSSLGINLEASYNGFVSEAKEAFKNSLPSLSGGGGGGGGGGGIVDTVRNVVNTVTGGLFGRGGFVQFKDGGLAKGPSHQGGMLGLTEDGMPFMFEGGEYIINKKSADVLGEGFLNSINSFGLGGFISKAISIAPPLAKDILERGISPGGFMPMPGSILEDQLKEQEREDKALARMKKAREDYEKRVARQEAIRQKRMMDMQNALSIRIPSYSSSSSLGSLDTMMGIDPTIARRDTQGVPPRTFYSGGSQMTNSLGKGISISNVLLSQLISTLENKDLSVTIVDEQGNERDDSRLQIRRKSQLEYRNASELV